MEREEITAIKKSAALLLLRADDESCEKGAQLFKLASEIEKLYAEAGKLNSESLKFSQESTNQAELLRLEKRKSFVSTLTPLITTVVLAGTLCLQAITFRISQSDKQNADEDIRWDNAVQSLAGSDKLTATNVLLKRFLKSPRYGSLARSFAFQQLVQSSNQQAFQDLFVSTFSPVSWNDLPRILELIKASDTDMDPLAAKANQKAAMTPDEQQHYSLLEQRVSYLCAQIAPLFKSLRPAGVVPDLQGIGLWDCDLSNADLSGANVTSSAFTRVVLKGANLDGITSFQAADWRSTAWWQAKTISPEFRDDLAKRAPYDPDVSSYGSVQIPPGDYQGNLRRLGGKQSDSTGATQ